MYSLYNNTPLPQNVEESVSTEQTDPEVATDAADEG